MPTDEELILATYILKAFAGGLGKADAKKIASYLKTQYGRYDIWPKVATVCRDLAKENLLKETRITDSYGKITYIYNITVDGINTIDTLQRDILERKKKRHD